MKSLELKPSNNAKKPPAHACGGFQRLLTLKRSKLYEISNCRYNALVTWPERMQRVQALMVLTLPLVTALTF